MPTPTARHPTSGVGACLVGNARAAIETTIELVKSRSTNYTGAKMRDFQTIQLRIGAAGAKIDATNIPFKGSAEAVTEVMSGRVDYYFSPIAPVIGQTR